ncbi:MAG: thioredoxin-disulfide reductase [Verrucomicrobiota bacterium]
MEKIVIMGGGCAGLTAAIYTARANLKPIVITGMQPGGLLTTTTMVENYPGFSQGIDANELMNSMQEQAKRFGADMRLLSMVENVDFAKNKISLTVDGEIFETKTLIIATGAGHRHLDVPGEKELEGKGVTYCATCDGALPIFRNKPLVVVGGGDSACEEAMYLTHFGSEIFLVHRRDQLRASKIMADRILANPKITPVWNSVIEEVLNAPQGKVTGVKLKDVKTGKTKMLECAGIFVAIGHIPNTQIFKGKLDMNENGYLQLHDGSKTNIPGVFAAGDCADHVYRQAITAAGMGCMAAIDAERYLASL